MRADSTSACHPRSSAFVVTFSALLLVQILTAMQPLGDLERLPFGADGGRVCC
jgi:hypothetical protein